MELISFSSFFGAVIVVVVISSMVQNFLSIRDYLFKEDILIDSEMNQLAPVTLKLRNM